MPAQAPGSAATRLIVPWAMPLRPPRTLAQAPVLPDRSRPAQTVPGQERPPGAPSGVPRPDRPRAIPQAPDQDVPWAMPAQAPGSDPYSPPRRPPTAPTSCTRRRVLIAPIADPPPGHPQPPSPTPPRWPTTCTAGRIPPRRCNSSPKPTMRRCSLPRSACSRFLFSASWPRGTLPRGASTTAGAVPPSGAGSAPSGSTRSPPSAVPWTCCGACSRTGRRLPRNQRAPCSSYSMKRPSIWTTRRLPPTHLTRKEHHPAICRRSSPLKTSADLS